MDWSRIVDRHGRMVFGIAWRILGHAADAEDVVQETFLEAYRLSDRQRVRCWSAFLRRLATFRALDRLRQRKPLAPLDGACLTCIKDNPEANAIGNELAQRLRSAIAELPRREASVFCLRYFEDLSNPEIAEALSVSAGAVAVALHKARAKLEPHFIESVAGG